MRNIFKKNHFTPLFLLAMSFMTSLPALAVPTLNLTYNDLSIDQISVPEVTGFIQITATLSEALPTDMTFSFSFQGAPSAEILKDFNFPKQITGDISERSSRATITIAAGETTLLFNLVNILDDVFKENDESLIFAFSSDQVDVLQKFVTMTIVDNEKVPEILLESTQGLERNDDGSFSAAINEDDGAIKLKLTISDNKNLSSTDINVLYSISQAEGISDIADYTDPGLATAPNIIGKLVIPAELFELEFDFPIFADTIPEDQETIIFKLIGTEQDKGIILENLSIVTITVNDDDANAGVINDTGVTQCYDDSKNIIPCNDPTTIFPSFGQDGSSIGTNDFVKLDADGFELSAAATNASCVFDRSTNLVWELKTDSFSYTWLNPVKSVNGGDEGFDGGEGTFLTCESSPCNTNKYANDLRTLQNENNSNVGLCQITNWRLPKLRELLSIMDFEPLNPEVLIDEQYFNNTRPSFFWTASPVALLGDFAWCVYFGKEKTNHIQQCDKFNDKHVRMVATCTPSSQNKPC